MIIHVAGGRRGEFNHRYAQPSVQPTPSFGHLHPYADAATPGPDGLSAGLLDRQRTRGGMPKIFYTDTSAEYWRGDAGLTHARPNTNDDLEFPDNARRYLFPRRNTARVSSKWIPKARSVSRPIVSTRSITVR